MDLLKGQTVFAIYQALVTDDAGNPVPDEYGDDQYVVTTVEVDQVALSPGFSTEEFGGTESITDNINVHMPNDTPIANMVAILINNVRYEVVGYPHTWVSPFTGTLGPVEAKCRLVTGGSGVR
jgi:hypothetical protein